MTDNDWDAYSLEDCIILNSGDITPSEHLLSLHPSGFWISDVSQMEQISNSVESIMIQEGVGKEEGRFILSNLPSLISIQLYRTAFETCDSITFESKNDWVNDEWDLIRLQSITLEYGALYGEYETVKSNELIMKSMNDNDIDWWDLPSLSSFKGDHSFSRIGKVILDSNDWWLMIDLDIPSLTYAGIYINESGPVQYQPRCMIDDRIWIRHSPIPSHSTSCWRKRKNESNRLCIWECERTA